MKSEKPFIIDTNVGQLLDVNHPHGYRGCGRAWVAVNKNGSIVALKYMGSYVPASELFNPKTSLEFEEEWRKVHPRAARPRHSTRRNSRWYKFVEEVNEERERKAGGFGAWREKQIKILKELAGEGGSVVSGTCSCTEFIPKHQINFNTNLAKESKDEQ